MNQVERSQAAARFLGAMKGNEMLLKRWILTDKSDVAAVGSLIAQTLGLSEVPTAEDLEAMAAETSRAIAIQLSTLRDNGSHAVGMFAIMQHAEIVPHSVGMFYAVQQAETVPTSVGMFVVAQHSETRAA